MIIFGIDFDGTFAADPELFRAFILLLKQRGHQAVLVTGRADRRMYSDANRHWGDEVRELVGDLMPIVFAGDKWKKQAAKDAGYEIDVWIDDNPEYIGPQEKKNEIIIFDS